MSLRLRLLLVILAVAVPMATAGYFAAGMLNAIQDRIGSLSPTVASRASRESVLGRTLSIEGEWTNEGHFEAEDIEELPRSRRPKLRAAIRALDMATSSFELLGRNIRFGPDTEYTQNGEDLPSPPNLTIGQRIEVSCLVDSNGNWSARKIETGTVKEDDKIKGTVTEAIAIAAGNLELSIDGLRIYVPGKIKVERKSGPLFFMEVAGQMALALQECLASSHALLKEGYRKREALTRASQEAIAAAEHSWVQAHEQAEDSLEGYGHLIEASLENAALVDASAFGLGTGVVQPNFAQLLHALSLERANLQQYLESFEALAKQDLDAAGQYLQQVVEPYLRTKLMPMVNNYRDRTEQGLAEGLAAISANTDSTARMAFTIAVAGLALALLLGWSMARSIARPIQRLELAAQRIGQGELTTLVEVRGGGEIGLLAKTFNRMSSQLAATMISVGNLNGILDSLAGGLFLLGTNGRITSVNPAALALLGYSKEELLGQELEPLCTAEEVVGGGSGLLGTGERNLRCKDGTLLPVTFAGAALRDESGGIRGYVCLIQDLRLRKHLEQELRQSIADKELLMRELHHRVKNNLQVISSLLDMQSRAISDPRSLEKFQESQDRIRSMVLIHEQLYRARDNESIHMRWYLELLTANLAQSHLDDPERIRLRVDVDELRLDLDRALSCGLIVNELVTNALKHAFAANESGEIVIRCKQSGSNMVCLEVRDSGRGLAAHGNGTISASLGMGLVDALTKQLQGKLRLAGTNGTAIRIEFAVPERQGVA